MVPGYALLLLYYVSFVCMYENSIERDTFYKIIRCHSRYRLEPVFFYTNITKNSGSLLSKALPGDPMEI